MFSDSCASMPESGFRIETSGHVIGAKDTGRRTNQRAAHAAPSAQMEPNMLAARQNNDSQAVANAPICSRAILHISIQKPGGIHNVGATGFGKFGHAAFVWASRQITHSDYDIATLRRHNGAAGGVAAVGARFVKAWRLQTMRACLRGNQSVAGRKGDSASRRCVMAGGAAPFERFGRCWHKSWVNPFAV